MFVGYKLHGHNDMAGKNIELQAPPTRGRLLCGVRYVDRPERRSTSPTVKYGQ